MRAPRLPAPAILFVVLSFAQADDPRQPDVRPPAVAGQFYPAEADKLEAAVRAYLRDATAPRGERPLALIAPHAGYIYSGQIAADGYRQVIDHDYDLVVILGVNHTATGFSGVSIYPRGGYRTPLGVAEIDTSVATELAGLDEAFTFHPAVHKREHSVEVHVPFVQVAFPDTKIVTAVIGRPDPALCRRLGQALAKTLKDRRALIVASSDLSHYPRYEEAVIADTATLTAIATLNPKHLRETMEKQLRQGRSGLDTCACGEGPILAAMEAARALGARAGRVVSYANSGNTAVGNRDRVVGYGAVVFTRDGKVEAAQPSGVEVAPDRSPLTSADRAALLAFARESIHRYLTTGTIPLARGFPPSLWRKQGVFVTLTRDGELRGCTGSRSPTLPLCQVVGAVALQSAFRDGRFRPVSLDELDEIEIEISLLTPLEAIDGPESVRPGIDGVLLRKQGHTAIFLPQVAARRGWTREKMLDRLCLKAGLPEGSWREGAALFTFQAEVFSESGG